MREIKFRVFDDDKEINRMITVDDYDGEGWEPLAELMTDYYGCDLMQYTGLKDKNGKEIYEGDILKCGSGSCRVFYMDEFACYALTDSTNDEGWYLHAEGGSLEVIGNIYESPELLKSPEPADVP